MQLVSIIICTYNGENYVKEQLESLLNQTYKNIEILIIDDLSTDNTIPIVKKIAQKNNNISIHTFKNNVGYIKNFERGIALANGELIALSDQDDWWFPTKIEKLVIQIGDYDLAYCDSSFVDENLKPLNNSFSTIKNMISGKNCIPFLIDNCVSGHAMLFKKELFNLAKPFSKNIPHDWWLTFFATNNNGIIYINEPLIKYRHHQTNIIASSSKKKKRTRTERLNTRRNRINEFANINLNQTNNNLKISTSLNKSYQSFSLSNNLKRLLIFYKNKNKLLAISKKSNLKKHIFIINMFFKIK